MKAETTLVITKITTGAVRYDHPAVISKMKADDPEYPKVPTLYLRKTAFSDGNYPKTIRVTVEG